MHRWVDLITNSSEKVDAGQKYLLRKSSSSVDIFILHDFPLKEVATPKKNCPKKLSFLKKELLGRGFLKNKLL